MPSSEQATGISSRLPPGTPEAPQADTAASTHRMTALTKSTCTPIVCAAAMAITVMVTQAPAMLIVAPSGIETP